MPARSRNISPLSALGKLPDHLLDSPGKRALPLSRWMPGRVHVRRCDRIPLLRDAGGQLAHADLGSNLPSERGRPPRRGSDRSLVGLAALAVEYAAAGERWNRCRI